MEQDKSGLTPGVEGQIPTIDEAIGRYLGTQESGIYSSNTKYELERFAEWCGRRGVETVGQLDKHTVADYATQLRRRADADGISASSAKTYYNLISALLTYCVRRDWLATNPAQKEAALQELPAEQRDPSRQQRWTQRNRVEIVRWADWRAEDAIENEWMVPEVAVRDRALVALLGYSGVRGIEVLADSRDDQRNGLHWRDVDLEDGTLSVRGKGGETEYAPLPETARRYVRLHKRRQDPASDAWPVFRTRHRPSLHRGLPDDVADSADDVLATYRENDIAPPSLSTSGGRRILETLSLESGIRGTDGDVLKPHAARRGLGHDLYKQAPQMAQEALRHQDLETTHEHYTDVQAADMSADIDDLVK